MSVVCVLWSALLGCSGCARAGLLLILITKCAANPKLKEFKCLPLDPTQVFNDTRDLCLCYTPEWNIQWYQLWPTIQIQIRGTEALSVFQQPKALNCQFPEGILDSIICILQSILRPCNAKETDINVNLLDKRVCFNVKSTNKPALYFVSIKITEFSTQLFFLFFSGIILFCFASNLCRSAVVYFVGVALGITAPLVFLLLTFKRFIPMNRTFCLLMGGCWVFSAYTFKFLKENITYLWSENQYYIGGYVVVAGFLSLATCYRQGPITNQWSINLITWTLQLAGCILIYFGLAVPGVAYSIIVLLVSFKGLSYHFRAYRKPVVRYLTEEEYWDQMETETYRALENLRAFCRSPESKNWLTVTRLSQPKRFAEFVLGSSHVTPDEANSHEEQFGFGSIFFEEQLFVEEEREEQNQQAGLLLQVANEDMEEDLDSNNSIHSVDQHSSNANSSFQGI